MRKRRRGKDEKAQINIRGGFACLVGVENGEARNSRTLNDSGTRAQSRSIDSCVCERWFMNALVVEELSGVVRQARKKLLHRATYPLVALF